MSRYTTRYRASSALPLPLPFPIAASASLHSFHSLPLSQLHRSTRLTPATFPAMSSIAGAPTFTSAPSAATIIGSGGPGSAIAAASSRHTPAQGFAPSSMSESPWVRNWEQHVRDKATFPQLKGEYPEEVDVCVVGGGIVGVSVAYKLVEAGLSVVLVEMNQISTGTTAYSTAKLSSNQSLVYSTIAMKGGKEAAKLYGRMNEDAINEMEVLDRTLNLGSKFERRAHIVWTSSLTHDPLIRAEGSLAEELGLPASIMGADELKKELPASLNPLIGLRFDNQAQFNPMLFCKNLAAKLEGMGGAGGKGKCKVFERTRVTQVSHSAPHVVTMETGTLKAKRVVLATHLPILDRSGHFSFLTCSRTHCISVRIRAGSPCPQQMYITSSQPTRSTRVGDWDKRELIIAGESMEQGNETDTNKRYETLEKWAREHFDVEEVVEKWSAMDYCTNSKIPYIGYLWHGSDTLFTATGFTKWGLANGFASASIIRDLITGTPNPYASMVDARRWDLMKSGMSVVQENIHTATHFIKDKAHALVAPDIKTLKRGEGAVVKAGGHTVGAYCDKDGNYHLVKPICTHLGCHLVFNQGDARWDCPCHGSRFDVDGHVIHGPACKDLPQMKELEW